MSGAQHGDAQRGGPQDFQEIGLQPHLRSCEEKEEVVVLLIIRNWAGPVKTTQDADPFELSASCVGVVPSLAPAEFCTTNKGLLSVDTPW